MPKIAVRPAQAGEEDALTALCIRSKAHWGYDADFMRQAANALTVTAAMIREGRVLVALGRDGGLSGVAAIEELEAAGKFDLALLFVEPSAIGTGVGRALFTAAVKLVAARGGISIAILADPFAAGFYRRLGALDIGEAPSDAIAGRFLPLLEYPISPAVGSPHAA
jgi:GNAT superfamily N-acetyltransferase